MTGKELKNWAASIPDDAVVTVDGRALHIISIEQQSPTPYCSYSTAELKITTTGLPRMGRPFPDAEIR